MHLGTVDGAVVVIVVVAVVCAVLGVFPRKKTSLETQETATVVSLYLGRELGWAERAARKARWVLSVPRGCDPIVKSTMHFLNDGKRSVATTAS